MRFSYHRHVQAGDSSTTTNSVVGCSKNMYTPCRRQMRNENRRVWSLQVEEGGIVQEVLRKQAGFTKKEISRAKFLPDGIRKNGTRCRVTEKTLPGDIIEILLETETQTSAHLAVNTEVLDILYEDQDLLAVNKPAGVVTQPDRSRQTAKTERAGRITENLSCRDRDFCKMER